MVTPDSIIIDTELFKLIPKSVAVEFHCVPFSHSPNSLGIAFSTAPTHQVISDLTFLTGKKILVELRTEEEIDALLQQCYKISSLDARKAEEQLSGQFYSIEDSKSKIELSDDGSVVNLVDRIITDAIQMKASDIHIEPYEKFTRVRYRIDGILHEVVKPSLQQTKPLISRLKIMADLDIAEKRRPQDGRIRVKQGERAIDIRVSSLPTDFGEKIVLRILDKSSLQLDLGKLGFEEGTLAAFKKVIRIPYGMVIVSGPTGSGKTTTLYAALHHINSPDINITTIEDPIEYNLQGINQTHVRADIGVTFAHALRSILRQDPNVIMVGEIRDGETAEIAIRAALTGHLVLSTLHTNDATSAITRLIEMGVEPFLVASSLKMILAQRLLRKLCDECKVPTPPTHEQAVELQLHNSTQTFFAPKGCRVCNGFGYKGRTAVYEVLLIGNGLVDTIAKGAIASEIRSKAVKEGMLTLRQTALQKASQGETSLDEVIRETT
jgi:type IV pilus assembly protein PilB